MSLLYILLPIATLAILLIYYLLTRKTCGHEWKKIYSETMWESNVIVTVYQCTKCGKTKREYRPI